MPVSNALEYFGGKPAESMLASAFNRRSANQTAHCRLSSLVECSADAEGKPCPYCGDYMNRRTKTMDHMVPLSEGGVHGPSTSSSAAVM